MLNQWEITLHYFVVKFLRVQQQIQKHGFITSTVEKVHDAFSMYRIGWNFEKLFYIFKKFCMCNHGMDDT